MSYIWAVVFGISFSIMLGLVTHTIRGIIKDENEKALKVFFHSFIGEDSTAGDNGLNERLDTIEKKIDKLLVESKK